MSAPSNNRRQTPSSTFAVAPRSPDSAVPASAADTSQDTRNLSSIFRFRSAANAPTSDALRRNQRQRMSPLQEDGSEYDSMEVVHRSATPNDSNMFYSIGSQFGELSGDYPSVEDLQDVIEPPDSQSVVHIDEPVLLSEALADDPVSDSDTEPTLAAAETAASPYASDTLVESNNNDDYKFEPKLDGENQKLHSEKWASRTDWDLYGRHEAGPLSWSVRSSFLSRAR